MRVSTSSSISQLPTMGYANNVSYHNTNSGYANNISTSQYQRWVCQQCIYITIPTVGMLTIYPNHKYHSGYANNISEPRRITRSNFYQQLMASSQHNRIVKHNTTRWLVPTHNRSINRYTLLPLP